VARNLDQFGLTKQKLIERKIREIVLAVQIEKRYTKKEIFTIYCNQMYLGHGAYGVEAASRLYFNKSNKDLNLEEAALIAGVFQLPERQSPFIDMKRATQRRNVVLQRLADERYITQQQADAAKQKPIVTARPAESTARHRAVLRRRGPQTSRAQVRREGTLRERTGGDDDAGCTAAGDCGQDTRSAGCAPTTSATAGVSRGAMWSRKKHTIDGFKDERWNRPMAVGDVVPAWSSRRRRRAPRACD
jgi:penicillin-binding protein 1A